VAKVWLRIRALFPRVRFPRAAARQGRRHSQGRGPLSQDRGPRGASPGPRAAHPGRGALHQDRRPLTRAAGRFTRTAGRSPGPRGASPGPRAAHPGRGALHQDRGPLTGRAAHRAAVRKGRCSPGRPARPGRRSGRRSGRRAPGPPLAGRPAVRLSGHSPGPLLAKGAAGQGAPDQGAASRRPRSPRTRRPRLAGPPLARPHRIRELRSGGGHRLPWHVSCPRCGTFELFFVVAYRRVSPNDDACASFTGY